MSAKARVPINFDELRPKPYPSGPAHDQRQEKRAERVRRLRALGINAEPSGFMSAITIGAGDADRIIRALQLLANQEGGDGE